MSRRPVSDTEERDERPRQLGVLFAAFTLVVLGEAQFDAVDSLAGYLALVIGGTGAIFVLREGIDRAWKARRRRRAGGRADGSPRSDSSRRT